MSPSKHIFALYLKSPKLMEDYFYISRLISGYISGSITEEEQAMLNKWRASSQEHERLFLELLDKEKRTQKKELYYSFQDKLQIEDIFRQSKQRKNRKLRIQLVRYAATIVLLLAVGLALYFGGNRKNAPLLIASTPTYNNAHLILADGSTVRLADHIGEVATHIDQAKAYNQQNRLIYQETPEHCTSQPVYHEIVVEKGGEYQLQLSDGTQVWLNSDTHLRFPVAFTENNRTVELHGEAYFKVALRDSQPFIVNTGTYDVKVLGTEFNISNYTDDLLHRTVLVNGSVKIHNHITGKAIQLQPEESFVFSTQDSTTYIEEVDICRFTAWKEGKFRFYEEEFKIILNAVSRWYDIEVVYEVPALQEIKLSLFADRYQSIEPLLKIFNEHGKVIIEHHDNTLYIKRGR